MSASAPVEASYTTVAEEMVSVGLSEAPENPCEQY